MPDLTQIGTTIRELRELRGWSQRELAKRAGLTGSMVSNYENKVFLPRLSSLARIADAFDATPSDLLDDANL